MTVTSRPPAAVARRSVAVLAGLALAMALLPLLGTAQAQDPPPNAPCPENTPEAGFVDRDAARAAHVLSIDCVAYHAISVGGTDAAGNPVYLPAGIVNRAQMATFIANTLEAAGFELPDGGGEDEFTDISGTVHRERINALARAEIVVGRTPDLFAPNATVSRAAMASFMVQAAEWADGTDFEAEEGPYFSDAVGTTHEANINTGFELGLFEGQVAPTEEHLGIYGTQAGTRRDQMATFLSRLLDFSWIEEGIFGRVVNAADNEPIAGAEVTVTDEDDDVVVQTTTRATGLFVAELDPGTYDVTAEAEGFDPQTAENVEVLAGQVTDVTIALTAETVEPETGSITGTVTVADGTNGDPIAGATVTAFADGTEVDTTTAADGTYELVLAVGTYDVVADASGFDPETEEGVEVEADTPTTVDFALTAEVTEPITQGIAGTVTEAVNLEGPPIEGATVTASQDGTVVGTATTEEDGTYELALEVGEYEVTAVAEGFSPSTQTATVAAATVTRVDFALEAIPVNPDAPTVVSADATRGQNSVVVTWSEPVVAARTNPHQGYAIWVRDDEGDCDAQLAPVHSRTPVDENGSVEIVVVHDPATFGVAGEPYSLSVDSGTEETETGIPNEALCVPIDVAEAEIPG